MIVSVLFALCALSVGCERSESNSAQEGEDYGRGKGTVQVPGSGFRSKQDRTQQSDEADNLPAGRLSRVRARLETAEGLERSNYIREMLYGMGEWSAEEVEEFLADEKLLRAALSVHPDALGSAVAATAPDAGILLFERMSGDPGRLVIQAFFSTLAEKSPVHAAELFGRVENRSNLTVAAREIGGRLLSADSEKALIWVESLTLPEIREAALQSMAYGAGLLSNLQRAELARLVAASNSNSLRDHLIKAWSQGTVQEMVTSATERGIERSAIAHNLVVPEFEDAPEEFRETLREEFLVESFLTLSNLPLNRKPETFGDTLQLAEDISTAASTQGIPGITRRIGSRLAYVDPAAAVDFFERLDNPAASVEAVTGIVATWVHADSVAAGEWVLSLQGRDPAVIRAAGGEIVRYLARSGDADNLDKWTAFVSSFEPE